MQGGIPTEEGDGWHALGVTGHELARLHALVARHAADERDLLARMEAMLGPTSSDAGRGTSPFDTPLDETGDWTGWLRKAGVPGDDFAYLGPAGERLVHRRYRLGGAALHRRAAGRPSDRPWTASLPGQGKLLDAQRIQRTFQTAAKARKALAEAMSRPITQP